MTNAATETVKETKAQRVERLKRTKNPWEGLEEIRRFAREGFGSIPPEWIGTYFRWWGVYTQGDGAGVTGGKNGEGKAIERFMVRLRIPNGMMTSTQLRAIADLTRRYANGIADLTVRQNIQLHWVTIESLPEVLDGLWQVGLNTTGACGDVTRNVTGCPVAGVDADEIVDASPLVLEASQLLAGNAEFYNLPRKFKMSITGCRAWCPYPEINDVGLTAQTRRANGKDEIGFSLRVAGGLSTEPYLAARLNAFVRWNQVLPVVKGIAELFRDSDVLREHRERARLKFLFLRHGWTADRFLGELEERIGFKLDPAVEENPPDDVYRDHIGIHAQKQSGLSYVGAVALRGRITAEQMQAAADLAVTGTFLCTAVLAMVVFRRQFHWSRAAAVSVFGLLFLVDIVFFSANSIKIVEGGWVPLVMGLALTAMMTSWKRGRDLLLSRWKQSSMPLAPFLARLPQSRIIRVPGLAVFLTGNPDYVPTSLLHNLKHNKVLHENVLFVTVQNEDVPEVSQHRRAEVALLAPGIHRVVLRYGFMESPNIPRALEDLGPDAGFDPMQASYFLGREVLVPSQAPNLSWWRRALFLVMARNAVPATEFFRIPSDRVVELGVRITI